MSEKTTPREKRPNLFGQILGRLRQSLTPPDQVPNRPQVHIRVHPQIPRPPGLEPLVRLRPDREQAAHAHASAESLPIPEAALRQYFDIVSNNMALDLKGTIEGVASRLSDSNILRLMDQADLIYPTMLVPNEGHWGGVVLALDENQSKALVIDSLMPQQRPDVIQVNGKNYTISSGSKVRTINLTNGHLLVFNARPESQIMRKQMEGRIGTGLSQTHLAIANDLNRAGFAVYPAITEGVNGRIVRQSYNRSYYAQDVDLNEILPHLARIPTQRDLHKCGEHSVIVAAFTQIALQALFIDKVRAGEKRFASHYAARPDINRQVRAMKTYKERIKKAEDLLISYSPTLFEKPKTESSIALERRKIRSLVVALFPSAGVKNGLDLLEI